MKYIFKDIFNDSLYREARVVFVTGKYNIFNNIVVDKLRDISSASAAYDFDVELLREFGVDPNENVRVSNTIDFNNFTKVVDIPSINGKWFTVADLASLNKKQLDWLKTYMKNPSEHGIIVITSNNFRDYNIWLRNKIFSSSQYVHLIELGLPDRSSLFSIVKHLFDERHVKIEGRAIELFVIRMSSSYDDYKLIIDRICDRCLPEGYLKLNPEKLPVITYDNAFDALKGIENFVLDDLLVGFTMPLKTDKISGRKMIFKTMGFLIEEYGARKLVNMLLSKIDELIEFRVAINSGYIPILVDYNVAEAKKMLGEESKIASKSDYQFKKMSYIAARTSLLDWVYLKLILENTNKFNDESYEKALYSAVARSSLTPSRINNDIGIENILSKDLEYINNIVYIDT